MPDPTNTFIPNLLPGLSNKHLQAQDQERARAVQSKSISAAALEPQES